MPVSWCFSLALCRCSVLELVSTLPSPWACLDSLPSPSYLPAWRWAWRSLILSLLLSAQDCSGVQRKETPYHTPTCILRYSTFSCLGFSFQFKPWLFTHFNKLNNSWSTYSGGSRILKGGLPVTFPVQEGDMLHVHIYFP